MRRRLRRDDFRGEEKVQVRRERVTIIERIVRDISFSIILRIVDGIGSRSQDEFDDFDCKLVISIWAARVTEVRGEGDGG